MKEPYQKSTPLDSRSMAELLAKEGQFLLPIIVTSVSRESLRTWDDLGSAGASVIGCWSRRGSLA